MTTALSPRRTTRSAIGAGVLTSVMIGGSVPVSSLLVDYPLLSGQAMRYGLGALLLVGWALAVGTRLRRPRLVDLPGLIGIAAIGMLGFNACMIAAQRHADPGLVAAVVGGAPLVLALATPVLAGTRVTVRTAFGAAVVVAGVAILSGGGSWEGPGLALAVLTMVCEAAFTLFAVGVVRRRGGLSVALWSHLFAAIGGAALALFLDGPSAWRAPADSELVAILVVALLTVLALRLWYFAVGTLGADRAGVLIGVMPVAGLVVSVALGAEPLTVAAVVGVVTVGTGCAIGLRRT